MPRPYNLSGEVFGRLTVIERAGSDKQGFSTWTCQCSCGAMTVVRGKSLIRNHTTSCGCKAGRGKLPDKRFVWIPGEETRRKPTKSFFGRIVHAIGDIFKRLFRPSISSKPEAIFVDNINEVKPPAEPVKVDCRFLDPLKPVKPTPIKTPKKRGRKKQIEGAWFRKLLIGEFVGVDSKNEKIYSARCLCGDELNVNIQDVLSGRVNSCDLCKGESK